MRFQIRAVDAKRQVVSLALEAQSEAAAREMVRSQGLEAFHVSSTSFQWKRTSGKFPTALFSAELMALLAESRYHAHYPPIPRPRCVAARCGFVAACHPRSRG